MLMRRSRPELSASNAKLDQLNFARRGLGGDPSITTQRPVMRRPHQEQVAEEESLQQKMANISKKQRNILQEKAEKAEIRRAKARERMAIRRAKIKALPPTNSTNIKIVQDYRALNGGKKTAGIWPLRRGATDIGSLLQTCTPSPKIVDLYEKLSGADRTLYDQYLTTSTNRRVKKLRAQRMAERRAQPPVDAGADEGSDLPDSSEISTSDSEMGGDNVLSGIRSVPRTPDKMNVFQGGHKATYNEEIQGHRSSTKGSRGHGGAAGRAVEGVLEGDADTRVAMAVTTPGADKNLSDNRVTRKEDVHDGAALDLLAHRTFLMSCDEGGARGTGGCGHAGWGRGHADDEGNFLWWSFCDDGGVVEKEECLPRALSTKGRIVGNIDSTAGRVRRYESDLKAECTRLE
ncbi:hypothetical protein DFH06DRAFT_1121819 [Mycena polygramma]|nr:hypothetical protein DFH06DRAFT_1121819 [Mycena polygramma]